MFKRPRTRMYIYIYKFGVVPSGRARKGGRRNFVYNYTRRTVSQYY